MPSETSEMVLRVAKAICLHSSTGRRPHCYMKDDMCLCGYLNERIDCARAAIEAMKTPTDKMISAGYGPMNRLRDKSWGYGPTDEAMRDAFSAMISAALSKEDS